jgi:hypothetical protein
VNLFAAYYLNQLRQHYNIQFSKQIIASLVYVLKNKKSPVVVYRAYVL